MMMTKQSLAVVLSAVAGGVALLWGVWMWGFCRVTVPAGMMAIVTAKSGDPLPPGEILAGPGQKGVRREPLTEGRHFLNPIAYEWKLVPAQTIPMGKVGVVTSKVGKELPPGDIIAPDRESKGVWRQVLGPGTYRLNPEGYDLAIMDAMNIPVGYVGIVTSQTGKPAAHGAFAKPGEKGVMEEVLQPGLYYINPKVYQVDLMEAGINQVSIVGRAGTMVLTRNVVGTATKALDELQESVLEQQQKRRAAYVSDNANLMTQEAVASNFTAAGARNRLAAGAASDAVQERMPQRVAKKVSSKGGAVAADRADVLLPRSAAAPSVDVPLSDSVAFGMNQFVQFPSIDGFQILLDMTVEFELLPENIARVYMLYGDLPAVVDKIILPQILSISRMKGSYYKARDFIDGEGRLKFQNEMTAELVKTLGERHILVHNAIIRHVEVPVEILAPIQAASEAKEQDLTNRERQNTARRQAELNTRLAKVDQLRKEVEQETDKKVATIVADTKRIVAQLEADTKLAVAELDLERARIEAKTTQTLGEAQVKADFLVSNEEALGIRRRAEVFKQPATLADLTFVERLNPNLSIRLIHAGEGTLWTDLKAPSIAVPQKP